MNGTTPRTASASFQLMEISSMLAPMISKSEEMMEAMACDTNTFTASTSDVRFVRSLAGVSFSTQPNDCREILAASRVRISFATRSEAQICTALWAYVSTNTRTPTNTNWMTTVLRTKVP